VVKKQNINNATIIRVNNTRASVDHELGRYNAKKKTIQIKQRDLWIGEGNIPSPLLGATRPYVPTGTAIEICVFTNALPFAGMTFSSALFVQINHQHPRKNRTREKKENYAQRKQGKERDKEHDKEHDTIRTYTNHTQQTMAIHAWADVPFRRDA